MAANAIPSSKACQEKIPLLALPPKNLPRKYWIAFLVFAAAAAFVTGLVLTASHRASVTQWEEHLGRVADANQRMLQNWLAERRWDAQQVAASPLIVGALSKGRASTLTVPSQHPTDLYPTLKLYPSYSAIYLLDLKGNVVASAGTPAVPAPAILAEASGGVSGTEAKLVTLPASGGRASFPQVALCSAVRAPANRADIHREAVGTLVLVTRPEALQSVLMNDAANSLTGESLLTIRRGNETLLLSPLRLNRQSTFPLRPGQPGSEAASGQRAVFDQYTDYRGVKVLAVTRFVPELRWGIVTKVDRWEVLANFGRMAALTLALFVLVLVAFVVLAVAIWRDRRIYGLEHEIARRREAEEALRITNRRLRALSDANQAVVRAQDEGTLLHDTCRALIETGDYRFAWTGFAQPDEDKSIKPVAQAGVEEGYLSLANISWADNERGQGPTGTAIRTGQVTVCRDFTTDPAGAPWREDAQERGYASSIALPLTEPGLPPFGALCVYSSRRDAFDAEEVGLLKEIAGDVSYGLISLRARAALRRAQERFELLAGATNDALWDWDIVSGQVWRNEAFLRLFRASGDPVKERTGDFGVIHPEDREQVIGSIQQAFRAHAPSWSTEHRMCRHDGTYAEVSNRAAILYDANGAAVRMIGGITDLTESKQTQRSVARLAAIVNGTNDAILAATMEGIITDWNDGATRLYGYTAEEAIGSSCLMLVPSDRPNFMPTVVASIQQGESVQFETTAQRKDGSLVHVLLTFSPITDSGCRIVGYSSIAHDITRRKLAEEGLRRYELLANHSRDIILFIRLSDGRIMEANSAATAAYGYSREELLSLTIFDLRASDTLPLIHGQMVEGFTQGAIFETIHQRKDGSTFPVESSVQGALLGGTQTLVGVIRDISERRRAEQELRRSAEEYRAILQTTQDAFWVGDGEGRFLDVNQAGCALLGYDRGELLTMSVSDIEGAESPAEVARHHQRIADTGFDRFETKHRRKDGSLVDVEVSTAFSPGAGRSYGFVHDITERKRQEWERETTLAMLRLLQVSLEKHELLSKIVEFFQERFEFEAVGVRLRQGEDFPYCETRGFSADFVAGESHLYTRDGNLEGRRDSSGKPALDRLCNNVLSGHFDPSLPFFTEDGSFWTNSTSQLLASASEAGRQDRTCKRCHEEGYESVALVPLRASGKILGLLQFNDRRPGRFTPERIFLLERLSNGIAIALEQRMMEESLRDSEARYRELYVHSPLGYQSLDADGRFLEVNPAWLAIFGVERDEVIGRWFGDFLAPEMVEAFRERFPRFKATGKTSTEFEMRKKDGSPLTVAFDGNVQYGADGGFQRTHCILHDVTERRRLEKEKTRLEEQSQQAQKLESLGQLAGGVAHDFNNLIMIIQSYTQRLQDGLPPRHELRGHAEQVLKATERAASLTSQLLAFSRQQSVRAETLDLNAVAADSIKMIMRVIGEGIELSFTPSPTPLAIRADPSQITQVLMNLCVNARDAMHGGGKLTIQTRDERLDAEMASRFLNCLPGDYAVLQVEDTGEGIPEEVRAHIFEPFFTTKAPGKGTGLGLSMVYGIVQQAKGCISVDSTPGHGTKFAIYWPKAERLPVEDTRTEELKAVDGHGEILLVVEDESAMRGVLCEYLRDRGYVVLEAADGAQALEAAVQHAGAIDLLLTDVVMPRMNGAELAGRMRSLHPKVLTLFMSGYANDTVDDLSKLETSGGFLQKPFSLRSLAIKLRDLLDHRRARAGRENA
jgi:PAS domain S-box-containing protein